MKEKRKSLRIKGVGDELHRRREPESELLLVKIFILTDKMAIG